MRTRLCLLAAAAVFCCGSWLFAANGFPNASNNSLRHFVTNAAQFRALSGADYLVGCDCHLTGVVTLVETNRDLVVVQDTTGAVALHFNLAGQRIETGWLVTFDGTNCSPYYDPFPNYPYHPSGQDIQGSFEAPSNWGEYHLTRMRGYLHPPVTGNYRFWIASDNSSELWLGTDASPAKARRIAFVARFDWANPRQWSKFPSQRSELIPLKAGEVYYIEAFQEQTGEADHLAVAWQIPSANESPIDVIDGRHLTPWDSRRVSTVPSANGILREYWTNFTGGNLTGISGTRPFQSALSVQAVRVGSPQRGNLPRPEKISLSQPLQAETNYRWVETEGTVQFVSSDEKGCILEISDGLAQAQVRVLHESPELPQNRSNVTVRVEGVCEGMLDRNGSLVPGVIWASSQKAISILETGMTNAVSFKREETPQPATSTNQALQGYYGTIGVVTFNDRVFDKDYVFIQEDTAVMLVNPPDPILRRELKVGRRVGLGGTLEPGRQLPVIAPTFVEDLGQRPMPAPIVQPLGAFSGSREGRWCEIEGVVHSVNANGTLYMISKGGPVHLWAGQTSSNDLPRYVDARLRARGILMMSLQETPLLLIPSRASISVEESAPAAPFEISRRLIADLVSDNVDAWQSHRARVAGEVTYRDAESFFVQDASGGLRVRTADQTALKVGDAVEVVAFPALSGFARTLTEPLIRPGASAEAIHSKELDLSEALSSRQSGTLVHIAATLLAHKTNSSGHLLELQEKQRVFVATLAPGKGDLLNLLPGSRLRISGVCDDELATSPSISEKPPRAQLLSSLNILLRSPQDVVVLGGPPWWTWKKAALLVVLLVITSVVALLWVHLLQRRLERQKAAQLAFSRHVLERLEAERQRIAANLHDSLGQTLLVIKNHAMLAMQQPPAGNDTGKRLNEISGATSQAIEEVRRITHGLRPYQLDRLGLTQAIRTTVNRASENSPIVFASRVEDIDSVFNKDEEIHVYRIVQEAVTNVVKHSAATEAAVVIKKRAASVSLSVRDNGRGFDMAKSSDQLHELGYGLTGIAERTRILRGTLTIDSRPGAGTILTVEVPISISQA